MKLKSIDITKFSDTIQKSLPQCHNLSHTHSKRVPMDPVEDSPVQVHTITLLREDIKGILWGLDLNG
jgi:hypothetical protein